MPLSSDPPENLRTRGNQPLIGNQSLPGSSNVLQTQPMLQPQVPLEMLTDDAIEVLSTDQLDHNLTWFRLKLSSKHVANTKAFDSCKSDNCFLELGHLICVEGLIVSVEIVSHIV